MDRETTVRLRLAAETAAAQRGIADVTRATQALTEAERNYQQMRARTAQLPVPGADLIAQAQAEARRMLQRQASASPPAAQGHPGGMGWLGRAAGGYFALHAAQAGLRSGAGIASALQRDDFTGGQRVQGVLSSLPVLGGVFSALDEFRKAIDGTTETMRRMNRDFAPQMRAIEFGGQQELRRAQGLAQTQAAVNEAAGLAGTPRVGMQLFDRNTLLGQTLAEEERRRMAPRLALRSAQARLAAAQRTHTQAEATYEQVASRFGLGEGDAEQRARAQGLAQQARIAGTPLERLGVVRPGEQAEIGADPMVAFQRRLRGIFETGRLDGGPQQNPAVQRLAVAQAQVADAARQQNELNLLTEAQNRARETGLQLAQRESDVRRAGLELARAELENLRAREQTAAGGARRVGRMTNLEFQYARSAVEHVRQYGLDNSLPETIARARSLAPGLVDRLDERRGILRGQQYGLEGLSPEFRDLSRLPQLRATVDRVEANVTVEMQIDQDRLAERIAGLMTASFDRLVQNIRLRIENDRQRQQGVIAMQQANQNP